VRIGTEKNMTCLRQTQAGVNRIIDEKQLFHTVKLPTRLLSNMDDVSWLLNGSSPSMPVPFSPIFRWYISAAACHKKKGDVIHRL
jgi:hypothetical protein